MAQMKTLLAILAAFALLCCGSAAHAADTAAAAGQTEKTFQIKADNVYLNVNGGKFDASSKPEGKDAPPPKPPFGAPSPLFSGDFMKTVDSLAAWDGFRPWKIIYFICGFLLALLLSRGVRWLIENYLHLRLARRAPSEIDDIFCNALGRPASMLTFIVCIYLSSLPILDAMPQNIHMLCERLFLAFGAASIAWAAYRLVEVLDKLLLKIAARTDNNLDNLIVGIIRKIVKICIVFVSVLFIGQNILGLNITTLLAGAGVAGLAIAFAAQDTIANFFGSLMIIIDQPFTVGDYVKIDSYEGTIERVGLRSSALRTPGGHLITIPNKLAANCSVENISRRSFIFKTTNLSLAPDTSAEKAQQSLAVIAKIYENHEGMKPEYPPRVYFTEIKEAAFNIQIMTWYHPADFYKSLAWNTAQNLEILKRLAEADIKLASQVENSYLLVGDPNRSIPVKLTDGKA